MGDLLVPAGPGPAPSRSATSRTLKNDCGPASIDRYNRQRQISVNANLQGVPLGEVLAAARVKVEELHLKPGYQAVFGGSARTLAEASNNFIIAMVLAVIFIYMVLASQFNSFVHPLTIMTALPLSLPAGLLALMAFGMTLNVYSAIGLMMLFGIVKKNSILQVDYTNTLREQGMERHEALIAANHVRLRPILMTTIAIVAGMMPIALRQGRRRRLARVDGGHDHRRPGAVPAADAARHAGRLLVLRRPARMEPDGGAQAPARPGPEQARDAQTRSSETRCQAELRRRGSGQLRAERWHLARIACPRLCAAGLPTCPTCPYPPYLPPS